MENIEDLLVKVNCNPLALSAKLATGQVINQPHPSYEKIKLKWIQLNKNISNGQLRISELENFWSTIDNALKTHIPSIELQSRHIIALTEYIHSKKKSVENINITEHFESVSDIPDELLQSIIRGDEVNLEIEQDDTKSAS